MHWIVWRKRVDPDGLATWYSSFEVIGYPFDQAVRNAWRYQKEMHALTCIQLRLGARCRSAAFGTKRLPVLNERLRVDDYDADGYRFMG